jgi:hypothetical protein
MKHILAHRGHNTNNNSDDTDNNSHFDFFFLTDDVFRVKSWRRYLQNLHLL